MQNQIVEKPKGQNGLGIASLILAIVAAAGCWVPLLNMASVTVAALGIVLGIWSFINVLLKKANNIALPIIGMVIGVLAIIFTIAMNNHIFNLGSLFGGSSKVETDTEQKEKADSSKPETDIAQPEQKEESKRDYKVGDIIAFQGQEVTVTKVQMNYVPENKDHKPGAGKQFVKINVKIENKTNDNILYNTYEFKIQNSNEKTEEAVMVTFIENDSLYHGELAKNEKAEGSIIFEVPEDSVNLKLIYQPAIWPNERAEIIL